MRVWLVLLMLLLVEPSGCFNRRPHVHPRPHCADGLPPVIEQRVDCPPDGICSLSCAPGRWDKARE
jgi:hypothetical protein